MSIVQNGRYTIRLREAILAVAERADRHRAVKIVYGFAHMAAERNPLLRGVFQASNLPKPAPPPLPFVTR
jgi:hypothetical protein